MDNDILRAAARKRGLSIRRRSGRGEPRDPSSVGGGVSSARSAAFHGLCAPGRSWGACGVQKLGASCGELVFVDEATE